MPVSLASDLLRYPGVPTVLNPTPQTAAEKWAHFKSQGGVVEYIATIDGGSPVRMRFDDIDLLPDGEALLAVVRIIGRNRPVGRPPGGGASHEPATPEVMARIIDALRASKRGRLLFTELANATGINLGEIRRIFKRAGGVPGTVVTALYPTVDSCARVWLAERAPKKGSAPQD